MKTTVSIPDDMFAEADHLTRRLGKSRSQLYTEALREYLARHDADRVTEALNRVAEVVDTGADPAVVSAGSRLLERSEW